MNTTKTDKEEVIRTVVSACVECYASGFSDRHLAERDDADGTINMKIHNVFIAALGPEIQYYSALARSLDSSLGNMLEKMAIKIASLNSRVKVRFRVTSRSFFLKKGNTAQRGIKIRKRKKLL